MEGQAGRRCTRLGTFERMHERCLMESRAEEGEQSQRSEILLHHWRQTQSALVIYYSMLLFLETKNKHLFSLLLHHRNTQMFPLKKEREINSFNRFLEVLSWTKAPFFCSRFCLFWTFAFFHQQQAAEQRARDKQEAATGELSVHFHFPTHFICFLFEWPFETNTHKQTHTDPHVLLIRFHPAPTNPFSVCICLQQDTTCTLRSPPPRSLTCSVYSCSAALLRKALTATRPSLFLLECSWWWSQGKTGRNPVLSLSAGVAQSAHSVMGKQGMNLR